MFPGSLLKKPGGGESLVTSAEKAVHFRRLGQVLPIRLQNEIVYRYMHMYVTLFLLIIQLIMVPFCEWYGVTHAESHLMCTVEVHDTQSIFYASSGVARAQPMPGHSTGTLRLRVASYPGPA